MTQKEIDDMPECGGFDTVVLRDGTVKPMRRESYVLARVELYVDMRGIQWMIGWAHGKQWKQRLVSPL